MAETDIPKGPTYAELTDMEEVRDAYRVPSTFANRVHVSVVGGLARITVGERVAYGETTWHASFTMSAIDAMQLSILIQQQDAEDQRRMDLADALANKPRGPSGG